MMASKIGPGVAACVAGVALAGCMAGRPVKVSLVRPLPSHASKVDLYYAGAVRAIEARDYAQALDYLQTARATAPDDVRVINAFGVVYDKLGRFDLSGRYYAQAKTLDPASAIVGVNLAYSERLQGLTREPLAFASAAEAEAKLRPENGLMPGSPVVVVPIAAGSSPIVMVETLPAAERAPELFNAARRRQIAAADSATVKPAAAQVARVEVAVKPAQIAVTMPKLAQAAVATPKLTQTAIATPKLAQTAVAAPKLAQIAVAATNPIPAKAPAKTAAKLAGAPILLVDASGSPDAAKRLSRRLTRLGWSIQVAPASHGRPVEVSRIDYSTRSPQIAQALARTLPGAVRAHACTGACPAIRLVVGKDALAWSEPRKLAWNEPRKVVAKS